MSPQLRPRTEGELKQAEEWKLKGNDAFRAQKYTEALTAYTQAISLNPQSPPLYSNRSATYLSLNQLPLALNDANRAIELDPKWAKAYRRKACVLEAQKQYEDAKKVYEQASWVLEQNTDMVETLKKKELDEVKNSIETLVRKIGYMRANNPGFPFPTAADLTSPGFQVLQEVERRARNGEPLGSWPPIGSAKRRMWIAEMQFHNARIHLHEFHIRSDMLPPEAPAGSEIIVGRLQTLEELTTAMIEDIRVARFTQADLDKLVLVYKLEQQQRNAIGPKMSPIDTIREYGKRLNTPQQRVNAFGPREVSGWDYVRPALQLSIRSRIMNGFLVCVFDQRDMAVGINDFGEAVELIEEARRTWPDVDGATRGRTLEETFLRGVKVALGEALITDYIHLITKPERRQDATDAHKYAILSKIIKLGMWLVESFANNPAPPEEDRRSSVGMSRMDVYYHHYASPKSKGHLFIAFGNLHLGTGLQPFALDAPADHVGPVPGYDTTRLRVASENYTKGLGWMAQDSPECAPCLQYAILAAMACHDVHSLGQVQEQCCDAITEDVHTIWTERVGKYKEDKEAVGMDEFWDLVGGEVRAQWDVMMGHVGPVEKAGFVTGWIPLA